MTSMSDEPLDAGLADVSYAGGTSTVGSTIHVTVPRPRLLSSRLEDLVNQLLHHRRLTSDQKLLLMLMVFKPEPQTAQQLGDPLGMTNKSVMYALRDLQKIGAVTTKMVPDYDREQFVRTYELVSANLPTEEPDAE